MPTSGKPLRGLIQAQLRALKSQVPGTDIHSGEAKSEVVLGRFIWA